MSRLMFTLECLMDFGKLNVGIRVTGVLLETLLPFLFSAVVIISELRR